MNKHFAIIFVLLAGIFWASSGIAVQDFFTRSTKTPIELTNIRMILSSVLIFIFAWHYGNVQRSLKILRRWKILWFDMVLYGIFGVMLMQYTYFAAIKFGNAAATTVITYVYPAMVIAWTSFSSKTLPRAGELAAVILAIIGVYLLTTEGDPAKLSVPFMCVVLSLASGGFFAFASIFPKRLFAIFDPYFLTAVGMFIGGLSSLPFLSSYDWTPFFNRDVIFNTTWIIIVGTTFAFLCFNAGLRWLNPEVASVTATIEPVASVVISYFVFGTTFGIVAGVGIVLVILAIISPVIIRH